MNLKYNIQKSLWLREFLHLAWKKIMYKKRLKWLTDNKEILFDMIYFYACLALFRVVLQFISLINILFVN